MTSQSPSHRLCRGWVVYFLDYPKRLANSASLKSISNDHSKHKSNNRITMTPQRLKELSSTPFQRERLLTLPPLKYEPVDFSQIAETVRPEISYEPIDNDQKAIWMNQMERHQFSPPSDIINGFLILFATALVGALILFNIESISKFLGL